MFLPRSHVIVPEAAGGPNITKAARPSAVTIGTAARRLGKVRPLKRIGAAEEVRPCVTNGRWRHGHGGERERNMFGLQISQSTANVAFRSVRKKT